MDKKNLIITPQQKADGYLRKDPMGIHHENYVVIRQLEDGNYLVYAPLTSGKVVR